MFFQQKFRLLTTLIGLIFLTLLLNVYNLQTSDREASLVSVKKQTLDTFYIPSPRGEIFDANNNKLVSSSLEPHLFLNLRKINDNNRSQYEQYIQYNFVDLGEDFIDEIFESEDLLEAREKLKKDDVILFRIEQLYPFPAKTLVKELKPYAENAKFFWCQEEPKNMGAWFSVRDYIQWTLDTIKANNNEISYIGRSPDASPATGYAKRHISQQQEIINKVFE